MGARAQAATFAGERPHWRKNHGDSALGSKEVAMPMSLFSKGYSESALPLDGHVLTEAEESCDPYTQRCPTERYVFEDTCPVCRGTGSTRAHATSKRGRAHTGTCPACHGLGVVRSATTVAEREPENAEQTTVGRPKARPAKKQGKPFKPLL